MSKTLYCIRHGTASHNVNFPKIGRKAYTGFHDTPLVDFGHIESLSLGQNWNDKNMIELVVVSPLTRTLETAINIFIDAPNIPMIALDYIKEHPQSEEICNSRKRLSVLKKKYPNIDFSHINNENDTMFQLNKRPNDVELSELHKRIVFFKEWIRSRTEKNIAVISHSSFLGEMMFSKIGNDGNGLKHCFPYVYTINA